MSRTRTAVIASTVTAVILGGAALAAPESASAAKGPSRSYLVVYKDGGTTANAARDVASAGGSLTRSYAAIGVVLARSSAPDFAARVRKLDAVQGAAATDGLGVQLADDGAADDAVVTETPATDSDSLSGLQWDMVQIRTPEAHAVSGGSSSVVVGDIDTGLDYTHPDLAPNVDFANSVSCLGGVPNQDPSAWMDQHGHGTHTAGTIAAASNGIGIVGVAPNVRLAGIRAGDASGFFFPEAVVCAFMWAGSHHLDVTNNSYFADPWLFNCRNDADQRAIWNAIRRAVRYAQSQGTVIVASEGNFADDLAHPTLDATSPDDTDPVLRQIHNDCAVIPVEMPGVVGVTADGNLGFKSFYSNYGISTTDVMAPGGDSRLQRTAAAPNGRVLSTWPASLLTVTCLPARRVVDASGATYCYQQGTSMAAPHAAGVAALIKSHFPGISAGATAARLGQTADPVDCPADPSIYDPFPGANSGAPQVCTGNLAFNSFAGAGQVNALRALTG